MRLDDTWKNELTLFNDVDINTGIRLGYGDESYGHALIMMVDNIDSPRKTIVTKQVIKNDGVNRWALVINKTYASLYRNGKVVEFDVKGTISTEVPLRIFSNRVKRIALGVLGTILPSQERHLGTVVITDVAKYSGPGYYTKPL